ncbi:MAG: hypothetical protein B6I34_02075 [Anaerolineaceae bacterium 4572_32.1]|nr:MAG: hypothetical protein B6I34_02075 [Anaerolineaceae bacterium 4572_32.1]
MSNVLPRSRLKRAADLRKAGIAAAQAGQMNRAQRYLRQSIALDDELEETWLWLAGVATTPQESERCLRRALAINPHSSRAKAGLRWARRKLAQQPSSGPPVEPPVEHRSHNWRYWAGAVLGAWLIVLVAGGLLLGSLGMGNPIAPLPTPTNTLIPGTPTPTSLQRITTLQAPLQTAWEAQNWQECVHILEQIQTLNGEYPGVEEWLIAVHLAWGQELVKEKQLEKAVVHFDAVRVLDRNEQTAQEQRLLALAYLAAQESLAAGNWKRAVFQLEAVLGLDDDYHDARELLYQTYYQQGLAHQAAGELKSAQRAYEQALTVQEGEKAQAALAQVILLLTPPTPTPTPKRIEVYIGQQRMYVYEGDRLVWNWVVSTGEPGRNTRTGHFQVLDKIPNAYASRWDLQMPHWLGIYYVGPSENGIHALPILSNGQRLWDGFLGQRVSYGCIILGVEEARLLYEWAEVGTPVDIYP